jgi:hypothetical protein
MIRLLMSDHGDKFVHFTLFDEAITYPENGVVTVDGDWYRIGETEEHPEGGWRAILHPMDRPIGIGPLHNLFTQD